VINNFREGLEADTALADIAVEQTDADNDVGELAQLSYFLRGCQGDKGTKACSRQDTLEGSGYLTLDGIRNGRGQLNGGIVAQDVLLVLIQQVIKDLLVQQSDPLEIVPAAGLETHDLINETV
jgi:hypothetical protein